MLSLNEVCENFIASSIISEDKSSNAAAETSLNTEFESLSAIFGGKGANDEFLAFDAVSKKRWIDYKPLMRQ